MTLPWTTVLTEKERDVLVLRQEGRTLKSIGVKHGVTTERIRQIEAKANEKIKHKAMDEGMIVKTMEDFNHYKKLVLKDNK